jgi:hypothetical protein
MIRTVEAYEESSELARHLFSGPCEFNVVDVVVETTALHHGETDKVLFHVPTAFRIHFQ